MDKVIGGVIVVGLGLVVGIIAAVLANNRQRERPQGYDNRENRRGHNRSERQHPPENLCRKRSISINPTEQRKIKDFNEIVDEIKNIEKVSIEQLNYFEVEDILERFQKLVNYLLNCDSITCHKALLSEIKNQNEECLTILYTKLNELGLYRFDNDFDDCNSCVSGD